MKMKLGPITLSFLMGVLATTASASAGKDTRMAISRRDQAARLGRSLKRSSNVMLNRGRTQSSSTPRFLSSGKQLTPLKKTRRFSRPSAAVLDIRGTCGRCPLHLRPLCTRSRLTSGAYGVLIARVSGVWDAVADIVAEQLGRTFGLDWQHVGLGKIDLRTDSCNAEFQFFYS